MDSGTPIIIAYEDAPSEAVLDAILVQEVPGLRVCGRLTGGGCGYLKKIAPGLNRAACGMPYVMLTDLDIHPCPPELIRSWVREPLHPRFLLRVAVREVEAWVLAHREACARFLGVAVRRMPDAPDSLTNPKQCLVNLARRSKSRRVRTGLVPRLGSTAQIGPEYNLLLCEFVRREWRAAEAARLSPSLRRAVLRLKALK